MAAKKKSKKAKKAAKPKSGRGVVRTRAKKGSKSVVVTAPKAEKKPKAKKKAARKAKVVATPTKDMAVPKVVDLNDKPFVVLEPPPDKS